MEGKKQIVGFMKSGKINIANLKVKLNLYRLRLAKSNQFFNQKKAALKTKTAF